MAPHQNVSRVSVSIEIMKKMKCFQQRQFSPQGKLVFFMAPCGHSCTLYTGVPPISWGKNNWEPVFLVFRDFTSFARKTNNSKHTFNENLSMNPFVEISFQICGFSMIICIIQNGFDLISEDRKIEYEKG